MLNPEFKLPEVALWFQAIGPAIISAVTALVALAVACIAYGQLKASREKLALDLFDRRFELYVKAKMAVDQVVRDGDARRNEGIKTISIIRGEAIFLFGDDVLDYLSRLQKSMTNISFAHTMREAGDDSKNWPQIILEAITFIQDFYEEFPRVAAPYMRMVQRLR